MRLFALIAIALCLLASLLGLARAEEDEICACPRNFEPVCGSDTVTYPNACELSCATKRYARQGRSLSQARAGPC
ncbi:serine protease inhibitor dipetalogastin [Drosophila busckii]|uniref:serine protease inhibitor dipetalogastin n=1 Tax=Drosophila busckii TaxID=30019 RepID=UPI001433158F|nr:serine protease inhibitor dipetalogastin [Drosophila busckii]